MGKYIEVSQDAGEQFYLKFAGKGKIVMLNLLKFRDRADYSAFDHLKPEEEISGEAAYNLYIQSVSPELKAVGSKVLYYGKAAAFLIGPEFEKWDALLLVEHESAELFISFAQNEKYLENLGHRTAALEDSRLLPCTEINI